MAEKVQFELVSPERILLSEAVDMVVIPGTEGYFGVLPGHAPLISSVRPGVIDVYEGDKIAERIFVAGGFAEVTELRCTVLADEAMDISALDRVAVEADITRLGAELAHLHEAADKGGDAEKLKLAASERALHTAHAKLEALGGQTAH